MCTKGCLLSRYKLFNEFKRLLPAMSDWETDVSACTASISHTPGTWEKLLQSGVLPCFTSLNMKDRQHGNIMAPNQLAQSSSTAGQ
jgi:hypothetical protein